MLVREKAISKTEGMHPLPPYDTKEMKMQEIVVV